MYSKHVIDNFKKEYGSKWEGRFFAWKNAHPKKAAKTAATAKRRGDPIIKSLAKTKKGKARARREK